MDKRKIFGFAGAIILFLGAFAPFISAPFVGSVNYFHNGRGDGIVIVALAIISALLTGFEKFSALFPTGAACFGVLTYSFLNIQSSLSQSKSRMDTEFTGTLFKGIADLGLSLVQIQWGFAVLIVGACFVVAAAAINDAQRGSET